MNKAEKAYKGCGWSLMAAIVLFLVVLLMLAACTKTEYITVEKVRTDTLLQHHHQRDSIWLHDSIMVSEKGDTIRVEKWHTKYIEKQVHDTTYVSKTDSIPVPYPVEKEVPAKKTAVEWLLLWTGILAIIGVVVWIANKLKRFLPGI